MSDAAQRSGVFLDDRPVSRGPVLAPEAPPEPVALKDILGAHWRLGQQDMAGADRQAELDAYGPIETALMERGPKNWMGFSSREYTTFSRQNAWVNDQRLWADVAEERRRDPEFLTDVPANNGAEFTAWVKANELKKRRTAQDVVSRQRGVVQHVVGFGADIGTGLTDPINLGAMIITGGAGAAPTIYRGMAREALINAGIEMAQLPTIKGNRARFGEDFTPEDAALSVTIAGAGGAAFHAAGAGVKAGAKALATSAAGRAAGRAAAPYALGRADLAGASDADVARAFADAVPAEYRTPDQAAALHVLGRDAEIAETSPFVRTPAADDAHNSRLQSALAELLASGTARPQLAGGTAIASGTVPTFAPRGTMGGTPANVSRGTDLSPDRVVRFVLRDLEGGAAVVRYSDADGGTTKYGIAAKHNPGVDVASLSEGEAAAIAKKKYWFPELDGADPRTAAIAFDAGYISGPKVGRRILAESGGDPAKALALYRAHLENIASTVPGKARYRKGWRARTDKLEARVGLAADDRVVLDTARLTDDPDDVAVSQRAMDEADLDARMVDSERAAASGEQAEPIAAPKGGDGDGAIEASAFVEEPAARAADMALEPIVEPPPIASIAPETRQAARAYVTRSRGSLIPEKMGKALGIAPEQADRLLNQLLGDPRSGLRMTRTKTVPARRENGTIIYERKGKGRSAKMVPQRVVKAGKIVRQARSGPSDLLKFIAERGGLRDDEGHSLAASMNLDMFVPQAGPLIRTKGMSIDEARELAAEAGYFINLNPDDAYHTTTEADFLDLLEQSKHRPIYSREDMPEATAREEDAQRADALAEVKQFINQNLSERGLSFNREQHERAADLMLLEDYSSDDAIARVVAEDAADVLDVAMSETDNERYEIVADEIERYLSGDDRGSALRDDGWGVDPDDPGTSEADVAQYRGAELDEQAEFGLVGPPPLDGGRLRDFDDPDGTGAQASADSLAHDLRTDLDRGDAVDPAMAERQRQEGQLRTSSPMRAGIDQESTIGLGLFDQVDQFRLDVEGGERALDDILKEVDADEAAIKATRDCL